jgi:predicted PurR-regulated permease PerM
VEFIKQGKTALQTIQDKVAKSAGSIASFGGGLLSETASAIFDLVLIFVLSVYMLLYGERIGRLVRRAMPDGDGTPADDYPTLVQHAVSRYVGGQLLFSFVMGASAGLALYVFGVLGIFPDGSKYAVAFAMFYGVMELIPYIGPILGAAPPVVVALLTNPVSALWVALLFVGLQQLEGHVVAPQIFGHTLRINPLLVIFALLLGLQLYGIVGALIALPILSILRETFVYLGRHLTFESWESSRGGLL